MISTSNHLSIHRQLPSPLQFHHFRGWRRRRLKFDKRKTSISCQLNFENFIQSISSVNYLGLIAPALGLASGVALYLSRSKQDRNRTEGSSDTGEWILLTSPTPFNRFVLLRCPSIMFKGSELLEDFNERLLKEDRHFVKLISGKIQVKELDGEEEFDEKLVYQRTCVSTDDGGVIALDWPVNLDLKVQQGIDTTVLLVPGTTEGSMNKDIKLFVCELLSRGCFPIVMNPRGCAGSPLTTARLFTAADSDDICTAIQFIKRARPWNTLIAVGWGRGANMLTKYLAEVAEKTPLTAATCIDNPFDLEESTRLFPYHVTMDQKLTSGLKEILRSNKELFQGRAKGFNVEKALSSTSLRDFEREISMVSYGFECIEEFYSKSSTRELVGNVKVPLLFIQSDGGSVPPFSVPRSSVAENPFTTMLLCSSLLSSNFTSGKRNMLRWCQHLSIEWLTAVELGLLKGRHPLLDDVDIAINPSAGLALVERSAVNRNSGVNLLNITEMDVLNGHPVGSVEDDKTGDVHLGLVRNISEDEGPKVEDHVMPEQKGTDDTASVSKSQIAAADDDKSQVSQSEEISADEERSQVIQSAEVVLNILDVTMPGALKEEQKKKVLDAMEKGDTLVKALEGALPEEVRGTLTTAVSEIVRIQGTNPNLDGIMNIPSVPSELTSKVQETFKELSSVTGGSNDLHSPEQVNLGDGIPVGTGKEEAAVEHHSLEPQSDIQSATAVEKSLDQGQAQSGSSHDGDVSSYGNAENEESGKNPDEEDVSSEGAVQSSGYDESGSRTDSSVDKDTRSDQADDPDAAAFEVDQHNDMAPSTDQHNDMTSSTDKASDTEVNVETNIDVLNEQKSTSSSAKMDESTFASEPPPLDTRSDQADDPDAAAVEVDQHNDMTPSTDKANDTEVNVETNIDVLNEQKSTSSSAKMDESTSASEPPPLDVSNDQNNSNLTTEVAESESSHEPHSMEEESKQSQKSEEKSVEPSEDQNKKEPSKSEEPAPAADPSSFNVSEALDALTGFDDSTQVAVNSVFGVLEDMIVKLEGEKELETDGIETEKKDEEQNSASEESSTTSGTEDMARNKENNNSGLSSNSDPLQHSQPVNNHASTDQQQGEHSDRDEKQISPSNIRSLEENGGFNGSILGSHVEEEKDKRMNNEIDSAFSKKPSNEVGHICKVSESASVNPYGDSMYKEYLRCYLLSQIPKPKSLDLSSTADLLLDYFPEEGQWKFLDQTEKSRDSIGTHRTNHGKSQIIDSPPLKSGTNEVIETSYVVLDRGKKQKPIKEYEAEAGPTKYPKEEEPRSQVACAVKNIILESLKVEVGRRLGLADMKEMESNLALDLEHVAEVVSLEVGHRKELLMSPESSPFIGDISPLLGEDVVQTISGAVNESIYLKKILPVGVVVGSILAALKTYLTEATQHDDGNSRGTVLGHVNTVGKKLTGHITEIGSDQYSDIGSSVKVAEKPKEVGDDTDSSAKAFEKPEGLSNGVVMAGAVTAAFGASALFAHQQSEPDDCDVSAGVPSGYISEDEYNSEEHETRPEMVEKDQNHVANSIAEKAMSVAAPIVPTKNDGGLDQERIVAMLSDLGQKGGSLRMIGKLALLWGGIRGAMSLTEKLISFSHIADRPLYQRLLGFGFMVLVLWSPVVIPLFPTLVRGWATHNSTGFAEYACVIGLYTAVAMLIILWGKRIRGYKDPLEQYGLDLKAKGKLLNFVKGLMGGAMLVLSIHSVNVLLGCAHISWSTGLPSLPRAMTLLKECGRLLVLAGRGTLTATVVVTVEEILFRSWLPQEISVDFGYNRAVILSGIAFSVLQRSLHSIPGLWLLSIVLSGLKQRSGATLFMPIGMRAGILSCSFLIQTGGVLKYHARYPLWLAGAHPLQPFDGAVGVAFCIMLAIFLYPKPHVSKKVQRTIRE